MPVHWEERSWHVDGRSTTIAENWEVDRPLRAAYWSACSGVASSFPGRLRCTRPKAAPRGWPTSIRCSTPNDGRRRPSIGRARRLCRAFRLHGLQRHVSLQAGDHPAARRAFGGGRDLGSVNTVVLRGGRRIGHNTDMWGFKESFRRGLAGAERAAVLLLGAGGAGAAVAHALLESGVETASGSRHRSAIGLTALASRLLASAAARTRSRSYPTLPRPHSRADGIVNATPVGMAKLPGMPIAAGSAAARMLGRRHRLLPARNASCSARHGGAAAAR